MSVFGEEIRPHHHVPVLDDREACIDIFFARIGLRRRKKAIEIGGVRLVLPVMLEGVDVHLGLSRRGASRLEDCRHSAISPEPNVFCSGNPWTHVDVLRRKNLRGDQK
jgi:hypothetical protein